MLSRIVLLLLPLSLLVGCSADGNPVGSTPAQGRNVVEGPLAERVSSGHEDESEMFELSRVIPSYGGHYLAEDGTLTAWVTDSVDFAAARIALRSRVAAGRVQVSGGRGAVRVSSRKGDFTYRQLSMWRDVVLQLGGLPGLILVDLDEGKNRVVVGTEESGQVSTRADITRRLLAHGVPEAALSFEVTRRPTPASGSLSPRAIPSHLTSYADELVGGLRFVHSVPGGWGACTIGFTASTPGGEVGFVAASHCSPSKWVTDGQAGVVGQPSTSFVVGYELYDELAGTCPALWFCGNYRFSDANFNLVNGRPVAVGFVAAPNTRNGRFPAPLDLSVSSAGYLKVVATTSSIVEGSTIDQIGQTTGWLSGTVRRTCVDYWEGFNGDMVRCAYVSDAATYDGDSGGPVFYMLGSGEIAAAGIVYAKGFSAPWGPETWFSKWMYVESEISGTFPGPSSINILAPAPPSYSVTIYGPTDVQPAQSCYWYLSASFPYTDVEWKVNGNVVGTSFELYHTASSSFNLEVQVSNSNTGAGSGANRSVTVTTSAGQCYVE